ncbi:hypothetical protein [Novosphingobium soli]|uniref:Uncharacterized protein n=1 Tax=Novosphingobium soli TaxID=574956 RepID=A0ABV6CRL8_9SPHN
MDSLGTAGLLAADLELRLAEVEAAGAFVAAALLDAAIAALCRELGLQREASVPD